MVKPGNSPHTHRLVDQVLPLHGHTVNQWNSSSSSLQTALVVGWVIQAHLGCHPQILFSLPMKGNYVWNSSPAVVEDSGALKQGHLRRAKFSSVFGSARKFIFIYVYYICVLSFLQGSLDGIHGFLLLAYPHKNQPASSVAEHILNLGCHIPEKSTFSALPSFEEFQMILKILP